MLNMSKGRVTLPYEMKFTERKHLRLATDYPEKDFCNRGFKRTNTLCSTCNSVTHTYAHIPRTVDRLTTTFIRNSKAEYGFQTGIYVRSEPGNKLHGFYGF